MVYIAQYLCIFFLSGGGSPSDPSKSFYTLTIQFLQLESTVYLSPLCFWEGVLSFNF